MFQQVVYDKGPVPDYCWENFEQVRQRVDEWESLPRSAQVYSQSLQQKVARISKEHLANGSKQAKQQQQQQVAATAASNGSR